MLPARTTRREIVSKYGRRSRPRAKSADYQQTSIDNSAYQTGRSTNVETRPAASSTETEESDELMPLSFRNKANTVPLNRSYSLDSDPLYQFILNGRPCSFLTSGLSVAVVPQKQSSIVTIFSIWNTIIGSSLLAMPWSVQRAGLATAAILMLAVATLAVYTAYRILNVQLAHGLDDIGEVPYLCKKLLGRWAEVISRIFSFIIIFGANIVYWILMSNCLYHSVGYFVDILFYDGLVLNKPIENATVLCPINTIANTTNELIDRNPFQKIWDLDKTVPIFLVLLVAPLLNFKSATFFTKFNAIGTLSVVYLLVFVIIKALSWNINIELTDKTSEHFVSLYEPTFFATSGMLPLSLFIHNIVITVMRNNRHQKNNSRDLSIAYILVVATYLLIGFVFYICFPLPKSCIEDNFLNNFPDWDVTTVIARVFLFFQLLTVYPLLSYMLRIQIFSALDYPSYPSCLHVMILNFIIIIGCVLFAIFLPHIGTIIRFTGAICGFIYIFTLPCLLHMYSLKQKNQLRLWSIILHTVIPLVGFINLVAQFFVTDS